jgi:NAD(P)-dependent dehydrogenase (short-subunit alcohol dehydrogenase family)
MRFKDKVAIVTGGGGKIGKAYAIAFAKEGAKVCVPDIVAADAVVEAIKETGGEAMSFKCDVSDESSVKAMVAATVEAFGGVDILVNNAAYFMHIKKRPFWEIDVEDFDKAMDINVKGVLLCAKAVFPYMKQLGKGKIVNISSGVAMTGNPNYIHYVGSKGAVISMTRAMARELGDYGIAVNAVAPGFVLTEGRQAPAEHISQINQQRAFKRTQVEADLVGPVLFLASPESDFMTGQTLVVDGGSIFL